ncbi:hypothetical protein [Luteimonas sp. e5]
MAAHDVPARFCIAKQMPHRAIPCGADLGYAGPNGLFGHVKGDTNMQVIANLAAAGMIAFVGGLGQAQAVESPATPPIHNVAVINKQDCAGPAPAVGWIVHPQREAIWSSGALQIGSTGYRIDFNAIPDYRAWTAMTRFDADDRGVSDNYVLLSRTGQAPFEAAYVVTHLPESLRGAGDGILLNVMEMQRSNAQGNKVSFIRTATPLGDGLEMITGGRVGSHCFPTSRFKYAESPEQAAVGISRFVVHGDYLIEYSLSVPVSADIAQPRMIELGQSAMDAFVKGLQPPTN